MTGEDISDELAKLVQQRSESNPSSSDGASAADSHSNPNHSPQGSISEDSLVDDAAVAAGGGANPAPRQPSNDEMVMLRAQFEAEATKNRHLAKELEEAKAKIMELNRRCQDATRAYEQERRVSTGTGLFFT